VIQLKKRPHRKNQRRHKSWPHHQEALKGKEEIANREEKEEYTIAGKFAGSVRTRVWLFPTKIQNLYDISSPNAVKLFPVDCLDAAPSISAP
jgi:hypothetical protein